MLKKLIVGWYWEYESLGRYDTKLVKIYDDGKVESLFTGYENLIKSITW